MDFDYNSLIAFIIFGVTIGVVYGIVALGISLIYSGNEFSTISAVSGSTNLTAGLLSTVTSLPKNVFFIV